MGTPSPRRQRRSAPAPKPRNGEVHLSRAKYDALVAEPIVQPRSAGAILDAIERLHPIAHLPRDLRRRAQIAGLARRLVELGATPREILDWMAKLSLPMRT
jgi:hypothetical protein